MGRHYLIKYLFIFLYILSIICMVTIVHLIREFFIFKMKNIYVNIQTSLKPGLMDAAVGAIGLLLLDSQWADG